jgi:ankyrin repeat protein
VKELWIKLRQSIALVALQNGMTAVMSAAKHGRADILKLLIDAGADVTTAEKVRRARRQA